MPEQLSCPHCASTLELQDYASLMVVSNEAALFTITCPSCGEQVSIMQPIPNNLRGVINRVAKDVGAGMGKDR